MTRCSSTRSISSQVVVGDGADDDDDQRQQTGADQDHAGDLDGPVAAGDPLTARLALPNQEAGLAVGTEGLDAALPVPSVIGDLGHILTGDPADGARACLGQLGGTGAGLHGSNLLRGDAARGTAAYRVGIDAQPDLNRLLAVEEIKQLKARYFRSIDTKDWAGLASVFTADATLESEGRVRRGRDDIVSFIARFLDGVVSVH